MIRAEVEVRSFTGATKGTATLTVTTTVGTAVITGKAALHIT